MSEETSSVSSIAEDPLLDQVSTLTLKEKKESARSKTLKLRFRRLKLLPAEVLTLSPSLKHLNVESNQLAALPESFSVLSATLKELILCRNELSCIPPVLQHFVQLQVLKLGSNPLQEVNEQLLRQLPLLQYLDLSECNVTELVDCFTPLHTQLRTLDLHGNHLVTLPDSLFRYCTRLTSLDVSTNALTLLPATLCSLQQLQVLIANDNQLESCPPLSTLLQLQQVRLAANQLPSSPFDSASSTSSASRQPLPSLHILDLRQNELDAFSLQQLALCPNLEQLLLDANVLNRTQTTASASSSSSSSSASSLPSLLKLYELSFAHCNSITELVGLLPSVSNTLTSVRLCFCHLTDSSLPARMPSFPSLRHLDLRGNQFTAVPTCFQSSVHLTALLLDNNRIATLFDSLGQLSALHTLRAGNNRLQQLPASLAHCRRLVELRLHDNQLTELPDALAQLSAIQTLDLHGNQLASVPACVCQMSNVKTLYLHQNRIRSIPPSFASLTKLLEVHLQFNRLDSDSFQPLSDTPLPNLVWLYMHNNQLDTIPAWVYSLSRLQVLYVANNNCSSLSTALTAMPRLNAFNCLNNPLQNGAALRQDVFDVLLRKRDFKLYR